MRGGNETRTAPVRISQRRGPLSLKGKARIWKETREPLMSEKVVGPSDNVSTSETLRGQQQLGGRGRFGKFKGVGRRGDGPDQRRRGAATQRGGKLISPEVTLTVDQEGKSRRPGGCLGPGRNS